MASKKIVTLPLFPILDRMLLDLLSDLSPDDWQRATISPKWRVKDIAAHLLDGNIRGLSMSRDRFFGETPGPIDSYADLVAFLDRLNADWVQACRRVSPAVLITLLELTGRAYYEHLLTLDPEAPALFSVAWAGEEQSPNWFHIAREYTEKWHHQQQIRLALGREAELLTRELYYPFLETSMRALPHHFRSVPAPEGTILHLVVKGPAGGRWELRRQAQHWMLENQPTTDTSHSLVELDGGVAWRLFTKGISREAARPFVHREGDAALGEHVLEMLAIMG